MKIELNTRSNHQLPLALLLSEGEKSAIPLVKAHLQEKKFKGEYGELLVSHVLKDGKLHSVVLLGTGKKEELNEKKIRCLGGKLIKGLKALKSKEAQVMVGANLLAHFEVFLEGMLLGNYDPAKYKSEKKKETQLEKIFLLSHFWKTAHRLQLSRAGIMAEAVNHVRDMVNSGPNTMNTSAFVKAVKEVAKKNRYMLKDFPKPKLEKLGMGGLLAVNRGSVDGAHLLILEHRPKKKKSAPILLVGKGIIFDTGGVNLKTSSLHEMHLDMAGAAAVLGVFMLLKKLRLDQHVVGIMPVTDNAIDSKAYRPSEIINTYSGKTVEVMNTDAEGRMILCDALAYGIEKYTPKAVIDIATLTGACMVALGFQHAGLFGTDEKLLESLLKAGKESDEPLCRLPITESDEKAMKGKLADLTNLAMDHSYAGASRGAAFLKAFVGKTPWVHIDIAGPAFTKEPKDYESPMGTGFGIRLLLQYIKMC